MDKTTIANLALSQVGEQTIMSLDESSKNAEICRLIFDPVLEQVLRGHTWKCATYRTDLAETIESPLCGWQHSYRLPVSPKFIKAIRLFSRKDFTVQGTEIVTNDGSAQLIYIGKADDMNNYDPLFIRVFYLSLAMEMAYRLVEVGTLQNNIKVLLDEAWADARFADACDGTAEMDDTDDWMTARLVSPQNYDKTNIR